MAFGLCLILLLSPFTACATTSSFSTLLEARIEKIEKTAVSLTILSGDLRGKNVTVENTLKTARTVQFKEGDTVILTYSRSPQGKESFYVTDYDRKPALVTLTALFFLVIIAITRKQGVAAILSMIISLFFIIKLIIPSIMANNNPFTVALLVSLFFVPITYFLSHGINKKTGVAILSTFITLLFIAFLAVLFSDLAKLTGFESEEATFLQNIQAGLNIKGILLAGIIIGAVAVLNDITISQSSVVASLRSANPSLTFGQLYSRSMVVGRDHIASLVDTLILVYAGAFLPLFLLFYNSHVATLLVVNQEIIATEVVRTLVSSIGIVAAVPITTYLACLFFKR